MVLGITSSIVSSGIDPDAYRTDLDICVRYGPGLHPNIRMGYYLDVSFKREQLARYGSTVDDAEQVITNAIGGENVSTIVDGRERYPANVRYLSDFRSDPETLGRALAIASIPSDSRGPRRGRPCFFQVQENQ
jgi:hypothetical protein